MRKVLFLDIDGVLNPKFWENKFYKTPIDQFGYAFDAKCVANLAKIIKETKADTVISSSWKCMGLSDLQKMWIDRKLPGNIIDTTPDYMNDELLLHADLNNIDMLYNRGCEIKGWLMLHGDDVSHYAILDDMDDILPEQQSHFVWIDPVVGITEGNAVQAINILNRVKYEKDIQ